MNPGCPPLNSGLILQPNLVKGFVDVGRKTPDRLFYLLYPDGDEEQIWELDGYRLGPVGAPDDASDVNWNINLICPKCKKNLLLDGAKKKLKVHPVCGLESEEFRCPHPAQFGGICGHGLILELPSRPSQRTVQLEGRLYRIDAVARRR